MKRLKHEFPTEWSLCQDDSQGDGEQPSAEKNSKDLQLKTVEPRLEVPKVFAPGASAATLP
jgi:hypothetical protein